MRTICWAALLFAPQAALADGFTLVTGERAAPIVVAPGEPDYVRLAAEDLAADVQKITGRTPEVIVGGPLPEGACVSIKTRPDGRWESYRAAAAGGRLEIVGSDPRGTMFGVYDFVERYLEVDPMGFWSGIEPKKRAELKWEEVSLAAGPPAFKFRGWFINDEDLLTFWRPNEKKRVLPYKLYDNMMHPQTLRAVAEALVRSRFNLVIPASFIDILNPAEEALVQECARRGLFLSMHHQEPMGVSAWVFFNYWSARGKDLPYSYVAHPENIREVWRAYAGKWSQYPNVIWQLGLRGKGDRPMWATDSNAPQSDAERGRIISRAMADQVKILDESWPPERPRYMSTTLWAEGSVLNQKGLLKIPEGTIVVFADNCPGWKWQADFHQTPRQPENTYGVYYHHALIGCGPHLAQAVPPHKTFHLLQEAVRRGAGDYAIFNVSNVREFVLGIDATAKMTWTMDGFDPDRWLSEWIGRRFSASRQEIAKAYKIYFNAYQIHDLQGVPFMLDGQTLGAGRRVLSQIEGKIKAGKIGTGTEEEELKSGSRAAGDRAGADAFSASLADAAPRPLARRESIKRAGMQRAGFELALLHGRAAAARLPEHEAALLFDNLLYPAELMARSSAWLEQLHLALEALDVGDKRRCREALETAEASFAGIGPLAERYCHGPRWTDWYRGCVILSLADRLEQTRSVLESARRAL